MSVSSRPGISKVSSSQSVLADGAKYVVVTAIENGVRKKFEFTTMDGSCRMIASMRPPESHKNMVATTQAGGFDDVRRAQDKVTANQNSAAALESKSDALKAESIAIRKALFYDFYVQAKKGGVLFDRISPDPVHSSAVRLSREVLFLSENQEFAIIKHCEMLGGGCYIDPAVKIHNYWAGDEQSLSIYFDEPNGKGQCGFDNGTVSLSCNCRLSAFPGENFTLPCSQFVDKSKQAELSNAVIPWLKKTLSASMKR
jgi:hypothetical protein